jgi:molybdopterin synthase catalytic subunit
VRVTVQVFARLREVAGRPEWTLDVPTGASVEDVWTAAAADRPGLGEFRQGVSCAVNTEFASWSSTVRDGDEVAFLPPVSGGAR